MPETCAIILAAGESERMRTNKLLLPFKGKTMIETVIDHVKQSESDHILVVLGAFRDELFPVVSKTKVMSCYNAEYKKGMLSSVQCGFRNMPARTKAAILFLGDQPAIPGEVAGMLIREYRQSGKGIVIPAYKGKRGHPVLIDAKYSGNIAKLSGDEGLRGLMHQYPGDMLEVAVPFPGILKDIDTPVDYMNFETSK
jgi:molybdenum cofactor cytidylyltransferase